MLSKQKKSLKVVMWYLPYGLVDHTPEFIVVQRSRTSKVLFSDIFCKQLRTDQKAFLSKFQSLAKLTNHFKKVPKEHIQHMILHIFVVGK